MDKEYITVDDIVENVYVSKATAYRLLSTPGCPAIRIGSRYIVKADKFYKWLDGYEGKQIVIPH